MRKASCISLTTALCISVISAVHAASPLRISVAMTLTEQPLIPLEKSLLTGWPDSEELLNESSREAANALVRGLLVANRTGEVGFRSTVRRKVQNVVRRLRRGEPLSLAGKQAQVSPSVLARLLELGKLDNRDERRLALSEIQANMIHYTLANAIIRGLLVANRRGEIGYTATLSYQVQDVVRGLRRGQPLELASNRARVSNRVVDRLLQLGHYPSSDTSAIN